MSMKRPQLPPACCERGAPLGRREWAGDFTEPCRCFRLRFIDGAYDEGGAYWGLPANVYCALSAGTRLFVRAGSRREAKALFEKKHSEIRWVN